MVAPLGEKASPLEKARPLEPLKGLEPLSTGVNTGSIGAATCSTAADLCSTAVEHRSAALEHLKVPMKLFQAIFSEKCFFRETLFIRRFWTNNFGLRARRILLLVFLRLKKRPHLNYACDQLECVSLGLIKCDPSLCLLSWFEVGWLS